MANRPLDGIRVLDFSRLIPGPYCTLLLARMGAEVIKVETPLAGDWARYVPPELGYGAVFDALNHGKRSLAVNYRNRAGKAAVLRLVERVDVFVDALAPGALASRGLGPNELLRLNPRLVYCSLTGYGQAGPSRDEPGTTSRTSPAAACCHSWPTPPAVRSRRGSSSPTSGAGCSPP